MLTETTNIITVPGGKVWSQILVDENVAGKPPLIVLHGGPGVTFRANLVQMSQANQVEMEAG